MGKLVTVKSGYTGVFLPSTAGVRAFNSGQTSIITEAEYATLPAGTLNAITVTTYGLAEPNRPSADPLARVDLVQTFTTSSGGNLLIGANIVTGPAAGVTYLPGFLSVLPNSPSASPAVVGPIPGNESVVEFYHIQGAVVSVAPTSKLWFDQAPRTDSVGVTVTNGSSVVLDSSIKASDFGSAVSGTGIPASSYVGTVVPGVSFVISSVQFQSTAANATAGGTSVTVQPVVTTKWPAGTVPLFTASVGAIDYFKFVTYDGGQTWYNILVQKGLA